MQGCASTKNSSQLKVFCGVRLSQSRSPLNMAGLSALGTDSQFAQISDCTAHESQILSLCRRCSVSTTCHFIARILLWIWRITSSLLSYTLIYSVIAEILLLIEVYSHHDGKFFALSCGFLIIPLLLVSFAMCFGAGHFEGACTSGDLFTRYIIVSNCPANGLK